MKNIIVMEDDQFLKEFYSFVFKRFGYSADLLEDGDVFMDMINKKNYNLIIMDLSLKNTYLKGEKVNGIALSKIIKSDDKLKHIPVVIVTAHAVDFQSKNLFEESMADDYIIKPISNVNNFIEKIESIMN